MIESMAADFLTAVYEPPPESTLNVPALNANLGSMSLGLGGPAGTGAYRTSSKSSGLQADCREWYSRPPVSATNL